LRIPSFLRSDRDGRDALLASYLGPFEIRMLESLWERSAETSVRDLQDGFPGLAYTTLMTTLDRLYKKGLLDRTKRGKAFFYVPRFSREGLEAHLAQGTISRLLGADGGMCPVLSTFVEAVGRRDAQLLDELEALIRAERRKGERTR
jgi:predicted transcriptional regulator